MRSLAIDAKRRNMAPLPTHTIHSDSPLTPRDKDPSADGSVGNPNLGLEIVGAVLVILVVWAMVFAAFRIHYACKSVSCLSLERC